MEIQLPNNANVIAKSADDANLSATCRIPSVEGIASFTIGMFFDGTGNNRFNVGNTAHEEGSYENDHSNVSRSWKYYTGSYNGTQVANDFNYYVQGIGTTKDEEDSGIGFGLGTGETGIKKRVKLAAFKIVDPIIERIENQNIKTVEIIFDIFGFSRGAAAARHFVYKNSTPTKNYYSPPVKNHDGRIPLPKPIINYNNEIEVFLNAKMQRFEHNKIETKIRWRFAGLYETVSSYGEFDTNFEDDVQELGLMNLDKVEGVFHIVAADEYRDKFSITPIVKPKRPNKIEPFKIGTPGSDFYRETIVIPGVHSDIGGGYKSSEPENTILYKSKRFTSEYSQIAKKEHKKIVRMKDWFIDQGWFNKRAKKDKTLNNHIYIQHKQLSPNQYIYELIGSRTNIVNTYSYIPLRIMTEKAVSCNVPFDLKGIEKDYSFSGKKVLKEAYTHIKTKNFPSSFDIKKLRNEYLHWSSKYNEMRILFIISITPLEPRFNPQNEEEFERRVIRNLSIK